MDKRKEKKPILRLFLLGFIGLSLMLTIVPRVQIIWELKQQKCDLEQQKKELCQQNIRLQETLNEVNRPESIEKIAREKLGLVKEGETVIVPVLPQEFMSEDE